MKMMSAIEVWQIAFNQRMYCPILWENWDIFSPANNSYTNTLCSEGKRSSIPWIASVYSTDISI